MSPNDAHKEENEAKVRHVYIERYKVKDPGTQQFNVGDIVRLYRYKGTFEKKSGKRYTDEVFLVKAVKPTKPITYIIEDLDGEVIDGSIYGFELSKVVM
jgi:hypothetical protein